MSAVAPKKGERFIAYSQFRPSQRLFIEVTRVARSGEWADIQVRTWAVMWTKRQKLPLPECVPCAWTLRDIDEQEQDHMAKLREEGVLR